ncbi:hypothetical protein [Streptomyces lasiicapitis]|uniref:hypothetical protein n=1 Tax=Streptomyces lasiicapitis TaxID=1923961 RepID=UPI003675197E
MLLHASSQQHTGSPVMTGDKVTRNQIALGPLTINNTRAGRLSLVVGVALVVLVGALAVYGGVRLFDDTDDSPRTAPPGPGTTRSEDRSPVLPPTTETVRKILPKRSSMDAQEYPWAGKPEVRASAAGIHICRTAPVCEESATAVGVVDFGRGEDKGQNRAEFVVMAFPDAAVAHRAYVDIVQDIDEVDPDHIKVELERRGEESQGFDQDGTDTKSNPKELLINRSLIFRQGAFIGIAHQMDDPTEQRSTRIHSLSAILADRIVKANTAHTR